MDIVCVWRGAIDVQWDLFTLSATKRTYVLEFISSAASCAVRNLKV